MRFPTGKDGVADPVVNPSRPPARVRKSISLSSEYADKVTDTMDALTFEYRIKEVSFSELVEVALIQLYDSFADEQTANAEIAKIVKRKRD